MSEIFSALPSPKVSTLVGKTCDPGLLEHVLKSGEVPGMRSKLYSYQRESVLAMMYREEAKTSFRNPLFIEMTTIDGRSFYFQPGTMEIRFECPMAYQEKGGMLCEELGDNYDSMMYYMC